MLKRLFILITTLLLACLWILLTAKEAIGLTSLVTTPVISEVCSNDVSRYPRFNITTGYHFLSPESTQNKGEGLNPRPLLQVQSLDEDDPEPDRLSSYPTQFINNFI